MITKTFNEATWRRLYQLGIVAGQSEEAVVNYWWTKRASRTDAEHMIASNNVFLATAELAAADSSDGALVAHAALTHEAHHA